MNAPTPEPEKTPAETTVAGLRRLLDSVRATKKSVGLVPTMGALHDGHAALIRQARKVSDFVVVSVFVNPIQFDDREDFDRYPTGLDEDLRICGELGVDVVFAPSLDEIYPRPQLTFVEVTRVSEHLCGPFRPGHFRGVATVVLKLLNIVKPDHAFFGEKDAQQLALVRRMTSDLNLGVTVEAVPTVREADGLALSSRNRLLTDGQRRVAPALYRALKAAAGRIEAGETDTEAVRRAAAAELARHKEVQEEYLEVVEPETMQPIRRIEGPVLVAGAVRLGAVRLIDSLLCRPGRPSSRRSPRGR